MIRKFKGSNERKVLRHLWLNRKYLGSVLSVEQNTGLQFNVMECLILCGAEFTERSCSGK